ncbi:MAG TPA: thioesterase family protein [Chthoniobacterales bacterium]
MISSAAVQPPRWFNTVLWGNTVALSWMWGLGLFFSVQFTSQFGLFGLLSFAIPNGLGLVIFGLLTHHLARREPGSESLAHFFTAWSRPLRLVFFLYQILAVTLTIFAFIRYVWQPLNLQPDLLFLPLTLLVVLAASILFGEEFNIRRIKWSHGAIGLIALAAIVVLLFAPDFISSALPVAALRQLPTDDLNFWGYLIPICIGFLTGPWLDLQQWQRAIQMHRERVSIAAGFICGAVEFFLLLVFHGTLALWALGETGTRFVRAGLDGHLYAQDVIQRLLYSNVETHPWIFGAYAVFLCACILTTLDSGYIALRWFLQTNVRASKNVIFSLIPTSLLTSPIPVLAFCGVVALAGALLRLELEYFMIFYATFFVGYSVLAIVRSYQNRAVHAMPQIKMFCIGGLAVVIFAYGYFLRYPAAMIIGSLLPLGYVLWLLIKPTADEELVSGASELEDTAENSAPVMRTGDAVSTRPAAAPAAQDNGSSSARPAPIHDVGGHFEGKWFVHSFVATYADTNSVGNVYFGMYAMWVGKTRELFFNRVMPKFNLKNTPFYILTRSFEHKFIRETREFETVSVRIRIASYNRKFVILEHEIFDSAGQALGKGKQSLIFVSSTDYRLLDLPAEVSSAFLAHT